MASQKVTIGRIVRYVAADGAEWPAIITVVHSETTVNLQVFRSSDIVSRTSVIYLEEGRKDLVDTWHWPERA